jgi:hypothetical protein
MINVPFEAAFGYPIPRHVPLTNGERNVNYLLHLTGYFPFLGAITGIARMIFGLVIKDRLLVDKTPFKAAQITRGLMEAVGFGPLLLLVDAVFTGMRCSVRHRRA